jgi:hypothetical protein
MSKEKRIADLEYAAQELFSRILRLEHPPHPYLEYKEWTTTSTQAPQTKRQRIAELEVDVKRLISRIERLEEQPDPMQNIDRPGHYPLSPWDPLVPDPIIEKS